MKKIVLLMAAFIVTATIAVAQNSYAGIWEGKMNVGLEIRFVFNISLNASNKLEATFDIPDQGIKDMKVNSLNIINDSLILNMPEFRASYSGKLLDDSIIQGKFVQQTTIPVTLKKIKAITYKNRPQTPVAPFNYLSEDVIYKNQDKSITYGATITIPRGKGPFPAVLLLTGSGQQNRDEEVLGHKPFAVIADYLTNNGFVVLRVDDRGAWQTTGDVESATTYDFAKDAMVSLNYLLSRTEVNKNNVGLIGHSEGAMIAQLVASERPDVNFIVSLAGPGSKCTDLMIEQNKAVLMKLGMPKPLVDNYAVLYNSLVKAINNSSKDNVEKILADSLNDWITKTPAQVVLAATGIKDDISKKAFIDQFAAFANSNWFRYFIQYDPAVYLKTFKGHYLAINGDKDIQVISGSNLRAIEEVLKQGQAKSYEIHELPGLNHLFQECKKCTAAEYGELDQTISSTVLQIMTDWLKRIAK